MRQLQLFLFGREKFWEKELQVIKSEQFYFQRSKENNNNCIFFLTIDFIPCNYKFTSHNWQFSSQNCKFIFIFYFFRELGEKKWQLPFVLSLWENASILYIAILGFNLWYWCKVLHNFMKYSILIGHCVVKMFWINPLNCTFVH